MDLVRPAGADRYPRREVRHGVPVYWMRGAPHLTVALMFRVGYADETPLIRGITYLVENLAHLGPGKTVSYESGLYDPGQEPPFYFDTGSDGIRVVFQHTGSPEQVCAFISELCQAIADLPLERLDETRRGLQPEFIDSWATPIAALKHLRFGFRTHGLIKASEWFLHASEPNPDLVRAWAREWFTVENATAWISGPIPEALSFKALPHGRRIPCPEPVAIRNLRTPAFVPRSDFVAISFVTDFDQWIGTPLRIAAKRLTDRLYQDEAPYPTPWDERPIAAHQGHSVMWVPCKEEREAEAAKGLLAVLYELADKGPTTQELQIARDAARNEWGRREAHPWILDRCAYNELLGSPVEDLDQFDLGFHMMSELYAADLHDALETSILMVPAGCPKPDKGFHDYPTSSRHTVYGWRFRPVWPLRDPEAFRERDEALVVGREGVSLVNPDGTAITVLFKSCVGAIRTSSSLYVIGEDGFDIWIQPEEWVGGQRAIDMIMNAVPDRVLRIS